MQDVMDEAQSMRATSAPSSTCLAKVMSSQRGEATFVQLLGQTTLTPVVAHTREVAALTDGDEVLVVLTDSGAIVTHGIRKSGERPQQGFVLNEKDQLTVEHTGGIVIKVNQASIRIQQDGCIFVDGHQVYSIANSLNRLQGTKIELN